MWLEEEETLGPGGEVVRRPTADSIGLRLLDVTTGRLADEPISARDSGEVENELCFIDLASSKVRSSRDDAVAVIEGWGCKEEVISRSGLTPVS